ncbi:hypothetical protein [Actinacidiphila guanduensis]|jgi:ATP synthase protein I|uniref:ATP synthase protein I n=1 Tax=Actinacidiphila guanduensis TaxID=310781 RepID=A0A1G9ZF53_9ACTN|nr:hypothetical protein [Actinacidiphila guanduensis]SDN19969.1 ATP synthase protein I [Actinacidiphila guanduensis]
MQPNDARILRGSALVAGPVGAVATVVSAVLAGTHGLVGGLVALAVVAVFFAGGSYALMRITENNPQVAMSAGMLVYAVQILLIGVFIVVFKDTSAFNGRAFGLSLLVTALAWVGGQIKQSMTSRMFYVDPEPSVPPRSTQEADAVGTGSRDAT